MKAQIYLHHLEHLTCSGLGATRAAEYMLEYRLHAAVLYPWEDLSASYGRRSTSFDAYATRLSTLYFASSPGASSVPILLRRQLHCPHATVVAVHVQLVRPVVQSVCQCV